jgi:predicted nuclease of predicted toxin-antitoxin system
MKLLFDQNISYRILKLLTEEYRESTHVKSEGMINAPDRQIWEFAKKNGFIVVTKDSDFNDLNSLYGFPPKVIWLRLGNLPTKQVYEVLLDKFNDLQTFNNDNQLGVFEILYLQKR